LHFFGESNFQVRFFFVYFLFGGLVSNCVKGAEKRCLDNVLLKTVFLHLGLADNQWGAYLFIADFFATQIIGGAKELVVLL